MAMKTYREIYKDVTSGGLIKTDDILRELGIDVRGEDNVEASQQALVIWLLHRVKEMESKSWLSSSYRLFVSKPD